MKPKQLGFELPELDRKKTQAAVEAALEKYRIFKFIDFEEREASMTASYSDMRKAEGVTSDQTASIAIHNIDRPAQRKAYCEKIERTVKRLHPKERLLIEERYMKSDSDYLQDFVVYTQIFNPPISQGTYIKIRWKAFYKLGLALDLAIEKEAECVQTKTE